jgi:hypothetical protein
MVTARVRFHPRRMWMLSVSLALLSAACVDLTMVTQFAKASEDVGNTFQLITSAGADACSRANGFVAADPNLTRLDCSIYPALEPSLLKVNAALFNYISSLGNLASTDVSKVAGGFGTLSMDLKQADPSISASDQAMASAASQLATAITNLLVSGYRQRRVAAIIAQRDSDVQAVASFLSGYAAAKYAESLRAEWFAERAYCADMTDKARVKEPLATELLGRGCRADSISIAGQIQAVHTYQAALDTIAATHHRLKAQDGHWDATQLVNDLGPGVVSLGNAAVAIRNAF